MTNEIIYYTFYVIYSLFDMYILHRLMKIFYGAYTGSWKRILFLYGTWFIVGTAQYILLPYFALNVITSIVMLFMLTYCFESKLFKRIVITVFLYISMFVAEAIVAGFKGLSGIAITEETYNGDVYTFISLCVVLWIISEVIGKFVNVDERMPVPNALSFFIILTSIIVFLLETIIFLQDNVKDIIKFLSSGCVLLIIFMMVYLYDSLSRIFIETTQAELIRAEKNYYYNQSQLLDKKNEEVRKIRHDIKNQLMVVESMIDEGNSGAKDYLAKLNEKIDSTMLFSQTGNTSIDSIINYKMNLASAKGISTEVNIEVPSDMPIRPEDMVVVIGNILDNAIEAVNRAGINGYIYLDIKYKKGNMFIVCKNSFDGIVNIKSNSIYTRKTDDIYHGLGLKSVEDVVKKYDGAIDFEYTDKEFKVNIIMYS